MFCIVFIAACAHRDEGEIDYRRANLDTIQAQNNENETIHIARLENKNLLEEDGETFNEEDKMLIQLTAVYIEDYTESPWNMLSDAWYESQLRPKGEIAVLATVTPLGRVFDFKRDAYKKAQVVFYSNDVAAGEFVNFKEKPIIYVPNSESIANSTMRSSTSTTIMRSSTPTAISLALWIIEVDTSTPMVRSSLNKLAQSFNGSDALDSQILERLGEDLLDYRETNDVNFFYQVSFVLPANNSMASPPAAPLAIGNYVFIRVPKTRGIKDINWAELGLDKDTGRLYKCPYLVHKKKREPSKGYDHASGKKIKHKQINYDEPITTEKKCIKYRKNNYLVIQIARDNT